MRFRTGLFFLIAICIVFTACAKNPAVHTTSSDGTGLSTTSHHTTPIVTGPPGTTTTTASPPTDPPVTTTTAPPATDPPGTTTPPQTTVSVPAGSNALSVPPPGTDTRGYSAAALHSFFNDAVFVGDSISLGWRNFVYGQQTAQSGYFGSAEFIVSGSLGVNNALWSMSNPQEVHPRINGAPQYVWDAVRITGAKKVFLMLGMNDMGLYGINATISNYRLILSRIREQVPDIQVYIFSATYVYKEIGQLNNAKMRDYNRALIQMCVENGYTFVNLADVLVNTSGFLPSQYCSDGHVHLTSAAYQQWALHLHGLAASVLSASSAR